MTFEPWNAADLSEKIKYLAENSDRIAVMGKKARALVEHELNAEKHYEGLMKIYNMAIRKSRFNNR